MKIIIDEDALKDLLKMDENERILFHKHIKKLDEMGPRKHFAHGLDMYKENVGLRGRIVFHWDENEGMLDIIRCFTDHKDYEKWYRSLEKK